MLTKSTNLQQDLVQKSKKHTLTPYITSREPSPAFNVRLKQALKEAKKYV